MTTSSRLRRAAMVGGGVVTALAAAGTAQAAQAQTIHAAPTPLAGVPASGQQAPAGRVMRVRSVEGVAAPDTYDGCDAGYFCIEESTYSPGWSWALALPNATLHGGGYSYPWGECSPMMYMGCDGQIAAFANNTGDRVWLKALRTGGEELCISNHSANYSYHGIADHDYWVQITTNPNPCP
jgi:hypothetical protein